jgi:hypothetical protein
MADGVDATVEGNEVAAVHSAADHRGSGAGCQQLPATHDPVLTCRQAGEHSVRMRVIFHPLSG